MAALTSSLFFLLLAAQDFVSTKSCAVCHLEIAKKQSGSHHAGALAKDSGVRWAFGAGAQAITYVSQLDEDTYLEHGLSLYAKGGLALTPGHRNTAGVKYQTFAPDANIMRCFQCHSTGKLSIDEKRAIQPSEPGVRCEACHEAGSEHAAKPARTNIHKPAKLNEECGQCHRMPPAQGVATNFDNPWNVRHQPVYFSQSACFIKGGASCVTCHDPHEDKKPEVKACENCHASPKHNVSVANRTCFECHMPVVKPSPQLSFTNHWIGIYKLAGPGAKLTRPVQQRPSR